jgi:hypothetical protein
VIADCGLRIADCAQPDRVRAVQAFTKVLSVLRGLEATLCVAHGAVCWGPLEFSNGVFAVAGREFLVADVDAITVEPTRVMICTRSAEVRP